MSCCVEDTAVLHEGTAVTKRTLLYGQETVHSGTGEYGELLIMSANDRWDLTRRLKG